jgi:nicotinamidase-related amidase
MGGRRGRADAAADRWEDAMIRALAWLGLAATVLVAAATSTPAAGPTEAKVTQGRTALVIIDIQNFYFPGGRLPLVGPVEASQQAKRLLERFRAKGWPVIHVQHLPKGQSAPNPNSGDEQYRIHPNVMPIPGEVVIGKNYANAFRDTSLLETLRRLGVKKLVICGMQTHMCVEATTRAAADLGFDVTVVHDACATRALSFNGVEVPAPEVHAAALAAMRDGYARIVSTDEMLTELR